MMMPPVEPSKEDCCNSGCNPCIFDIYEKQLELYNKYLQSGEAFVEPDKNGISQTEYTTFVVTENMHVCESHKLIKFKKKLCDNDKTYWRPGDHFLLKFSSETGTVTRAYTPIKLRNQIQEDFDFSVIVKKYDNGLVSHYLYNLKPNDETLWRGPYGCYDVEPNKFKRIFMIAQGTGIAAFLPIIEKIIDNEDDFTKLFLYYCCPNVESILFRDCLFSFKSYWNFTYKVFLKESSFDGCLKYQEPVSNNKLSIKEFVDVKPFDTNDQFLVCGSTNFMKSYQDWLLNEENFQGNIVLF